MSDITLKFNSVSNAYDLASDDFAILSKAFILSQNSDGSIISITLNTNLYDPELVIKNLQIQATAIQQEIAQATAIQQDQLT